MTYPKLTFVACAFFVMGLLIGCGSSSESTGTAEGEPSAEMEAEPEASTPQVTETTVYCLYDKLSIREDAGRDAKWLAAMNLGEKVTFTGELKEDAAQDNREYAQIRLSDGKVGWAPTNLLLMEGSIAVTLDDVSMYDRPDLLTKNSKGIPRMTIVGMYNGQDDWTEIKGIPQGETWYTAGWTKSPRISDDAEDIAAALMIARAMGEEDADKKKEALESVVNDFSNSVFAVDASEMLVKMASDEGEEMEEEPMEEEGEM
ncbi:MAG TPA: hypothetical protein DCR93_33765 [Cytophagales bacterium]|nr:hypothetical protein [Cytophagales bacterium]HAP64243.1 hypothetical protein [Cytophagales bacterium]